MNSTVIPAESPMNILVYVLGGLLLLAAAYCFFAFVTLQRSKRPHHCRNCDDDTLEYIGFSAEPFNGQSQKKTSFDGRTIDANNAS